MIPGGLDLLAISSLRAARMGISGLVLIALFIVLTLVLITLFSRHHGDATGAGVAGFVALSFMFCTLGSAFGGGALPYLPLCLVSGVGSFAAAGPLLELPVLHRLALAALIPLAFLASSLAGIAVESFVLENALK